MSKTRGERNTRSIEVNTEFVNMDVAKDVLQKFLASEDDNLTPTVHVGVNQRELNYSDKEYEKV